jgi:hypothetical protein
VATICGLWIVAALSAVPSGLSKYLWEEFLDVNLIMNYQRLVIFDLLVSCLLPLFANAMTVRHLMENSRSISEGKQNPQMNTNRNTAKIVVGLTVVFVISYVPFHVFWTYLICS